MEFNEYKWYGATMMALVAVVGLLLVLLRNRLGVSSTYFNIYHPIWQAAILFIVLFYVVDMTKAGGDLAIFQSAFFVAEEDDTRPLSNSLYLPVIIAVLFGFAVVGVVSGTGSLYAVPNAVGSTLSYTNPTELAQSSPGTYYLTGVVPGVLEESIGFIIITFMSLILTGITAMIRRNSDAFESLSVVWFWRIVTCLTYSFFFSYAHAQYVGDGAMNAWAVVFEFSVQMLNQAGGVFVSWIPHMMHNSAVVATRTVSLAPFSIAAFGMVLLLPRWKHD